MLPVFPAGVPPERIASASTAEASSAGDLGLRHGLGVMGALHHGGRGMNGKFRGETLSAMCNDAQWFRVDATLNANGPNRETCR